MEMYAFHICILPILFDQLAFADFLMCINRFRLPRSYEFQS